MVRLQLQTDGSENMIMVFLNIIYGHPIQSQLTLISSRKYDVLKGN